MEFHTNIAKTREYGNSSDDLHCYVSCAMKIASRWGWGLANVTLLYGLSSKC